MSKNDFKKKVCENENHFFFQIFLTHFFSYSYMINGNIVFDQNRTKTIRKKVKKSDFFGIFRNFLEFFGAEWTTFGQLWITMDNL